jgi:hypothetical protein
MWGAGFLSTTTQGVAHINLNSQDHLWREGRSGDNYWRGYLLESGYAKWQSLGCTAREYDAADPLICSYNGPHANCNNPFEPNPVSEQFRKRPAFVWYGPGCTNEFDNVAIYNGGPPGDYKRRSPLLTCPQPFVAFVAGGNKIFHVPHRMQWSRPNFGGSMTLMPYAENVGYSDGSVRFYFNSVGGTFKPD